MGRIEQINELLKENPRDSFLQHALALEYLKQGKDLEAKIIFEKLLSENEDYVGSYYHLAKLLEKLGDEAEAIRVYEQGMQVAKACHDQHAYRELQAAYELLIY